jgi:hypothetical protein
MVGRSAGLGAETSGTMLSHYVVMHRFPHSQMAPLRTVALLSATIRMCVLRESVMASEDHVRRTYVC